MRIVPFQTVSRLRAHESNVTGLAYETELASPPAPQ
jgi:hypothetical protein